MVVVHRAKIPETGTSMTEEEKVASIDKENGLGGLADIRGSPFRLLRPCHAPSLRRPHDLQNFGANCKDVSQYGSLSYVYLCTGAIYQTDGSYWIDNACMYG